MLTFVLATNNKGKMAEFSAILSDSDIKLILPRDAGIVLCAEETGDTFEQNALIKARAAFVPGKYGAIADDSGLCVDALCGAPGIFSARYEKDDKSCINRLLSELSSVPKERRTAHFVCAVACIMPDGREFTVRGECHGVIACEPAGDNGFGYDPVFFSPEYGMTFGQMPSGLKNQISHRAAALSALSRELLKYLP